ncbi:MAG: ankyrin repeat domain-containing protein [Halioglobus sp.]|nr:ankyrin repeat domain-containing protein [Halioglobus sp.]
MSMFTRLRLAALVGLSFLVFASTLSVASELIDATRAGDAERVARLLTDRPDLNEATGDGMTAAHWAAQSGHVAILQFLLDAGANVDPATRIGSYTPLHIASGQANGAIVSLLLQAGADVNASTTNSNATALHLAAQAVGGAKSVEALLEHGADVNAKEGAAGQTPLMFAAAKNRVESVELLLAAGADPSASTIVVEVLKEVFADRQASRFLQDALSEYEYTNNDKALDSSAVDKVQAAIKAQREFLQSGEAYQNFSPEALITLRPDYPEGPDLPRPPYRESLVGATGGMTALLHAAREGHSESAIALLKGGADVNQVSGADATSPLLIAALNGQFDVAMLLIEHGADPNLAAKTDGAGPLFATLQTQWAPKSNFPQPRAQDLQKTEYMEVVNALLEAGADANVRLNTHLWYFEYGLTKIGTDLKGATPFWRAAYAQDIEAMQLLLAHGAEPNIPTAWPAPEMRERRQQDGRQQEDSGLPYIPNDAFNAYPIHVAAGGGFTGLGSFSVRSVPESFIPAVKYLVEELGQDVNTLDSWGFTPMHYAASRGDNELIRYLVSEGGDVSVITRLGQSTADMARGGRSGFFTRVAFPETEKLLIEL